MKVIRDASEAEMILEFLKGEMDSVRFNNELFDVLSDLGIDRNIIDNGDIFNSDENKKRFEILKLFRGYPDSELFNNFPKNVKWKYCELSSNDINNIYYINYDYWNELSNNTGSPLEAVKNIKNGIEIYEVSNKPILDGVNLLGKKMFPPIILLTCNDKKYVIIEGHSRMTIYGFNPSKLNGTYAYIGYCNSEEMNQYDSRMI